MEEGQKAAERETLINGVDLNKNTIAFYDERSRLVHADADEKLVFLFDYRSNDKETELIRWQHLKQLKDSNKWGVIRHPLVLNFINERLLDCALFYVVHVFAFFSFLLLLSSHVFSPHWWKDVAVTAFVIVFFFFMMVKGMIKARISHSISAWFIVAFTFNILTYLATLCYVWLPYLFEYDDFHVELKKIIMWFLPIIAIISAWINFLYILRKSPYGIYIFMMVRILKSFGHIATIWIPTLIAFSFAFHLILRDSGVEPWESTDHHKNATTLQKLFVILQAVTKTSTMMIGEVDADNILGTNQWIPSILILIFEIITVILLMNLMVSLAVGDVSDLRISAQDKILRIKVNFVVEALQLSEESPFPFLSSLYTQRTNNLLVVSLDEYDYYTVMNDALVRKAFDEKNEPTAPGFRSVSAAPFANLREMSPSLTSYATANTTPPTTDLVYHMTFSKPRMRVRVARRPLYGRTQQLHIEGCELRLQESPESGIAEYKPGLQIIPDPEPGLWIRRLKQWIIGLDWHVYLEL